MAGAAVFCVYFVLFFSHSYRWNIPAVWLILDEIAPQWVGGNWEQFTFSDRLPILVGAALQIAAAWLVGRFLLGLIAAEQGMTRLEIAVFSWGTGFAALSLWTLAVGLAGGLHLPLAFLLPVGGIAIFLALRRRRLIALLGPNDPSEKADSDSDTSPRPKAKVSSNGSARWLWLAAPFLVVLLLGSLIPSTHFDVREYHLQVPKEWSQSGRISFLPHNVYGNMPLGAEMHALLPMSLWPGKDGWWHGSLVGKVVIAAFVPLTGLALLAFGQRFFSISAGVLAAILYVSIPSVAGLSKEGMIDGVVACYAFLAFYAVCLWRLGVPGHLARGAALAGFLAGAAAATKYPAVVFVVAPLSVYVALADRKLRVAALTVFLCGAALGGGLWYAKNQVVTGNPVYPLAYGVFGGTTRTPEKDAQWRKAHAVPADTAGRRYSPRQLIESIQRVVLQTEHNSPLLIPFAALALLAFRRQSVVHAAIAYFAIMFFAWWLLTHRIDRFLLPALPLLAMLAGAGAAWQTSKPWRVVVGVALAIGLASNLAAGFTIICGDNRFFVPLQTLRNDSSWNESIERGTPPGWQALFVGDAQPFNLETPVLYNTCFDDNLLEAMTKGRTPQERSAELLRHKIALVVVDWSEIRRYLETYGYTDYVTLPRLEEMVDQGVLGSPRPPFPPSVSGLYDERLPPRQIFPVIGAPVDLAHPRAMR